MSEAKMHSISNQNAILSSVVLIFLWVNASEIFRYFVYVMPMMRDAFPSLPDVAPMSWPIFLSWAVWDMVLVAAVSVIAWLSLTRFGSSARVVLLTGTGIWASIFVILWLGLWNMNLATGPIVSLALVLAWIEMVVATGIMGWGVRRASTPD